MTIRPTQHYRIAKTFYQKYWTTDDRSDLHFYYGEWQVHPDYPEEYIDLPDEIRWEVIGFLEECEVYRAKDDGWENLPPTEDYYPSVQFVDDVMRALTDIAAENYRWYRRKLHFITTINEKGGV
jgi:hypothetical protein